MIVSPPPVVPWHANDRLDQQYYESQGSRKYKQLIQGEVYHGSIPKKGATADQSVSVPVGTLKRDLACLTIPFDSV